MPSPASPLADATQRPGQQLHTSCSTSPLPNLPLPSATCPGGALPDRGAAVRANHFGQQLQLWLPDSFHRLLVHGIATYHDLSSFSQDASAGAVQGGPSPHATTNGTSQQNGMPVANSATRSQLANNGSDVNWHQPAVGTYCSKAVERVSSAAPLAPGRVTVVRQSQQGEHQQLVDDAIMVTDVVLVLGQRGRGSLTAAMLEVPGTPSSECYGPRCL